MKKAVFCGLFLLSFLFLPKVVSAATLYLSPASGSYSVGSTIIVGVRTNTQGAAVNTAEANISFSTDTLELVSVSQGASFYLPAPGSPSKSASGAYFGGGVPTPGYNGASGGIGTLTFRAKAQGTATVSISSGKVLLNDGLGTNALSSSSGARFTISPPAVGTPQVSSSTHPDQGKWYNTNKIDLSWSRPNGAYGFSFDLNQRDNTIPDNELDTTVTTTKSYADLADGVWYFHIKARRQDAGSGFGATEHFKISIDTKVPEAFELKLVGDNPAALESVTPTISFETTDGGSGIEKYNVYFDDELYRENITSPFTLDSIKGGDHKIKVLAYDKAGNTSSSELDVSIKQAQIDYLASLKKEVSLPMYWIILNGLLWLIAVILLIWLLARKKREVRSSAEVDITQMQEAIDDSLENLNQEISQKLLGLSAKSTEDLFDKETQVVKQIRTGIGKTRKNIDSKISKLKRKSTKAE